MFGIRAEKGKERKMPSTEKEGERNILWLKQTRDPEPGGCSEAGNGEGGTVRVDVERGLKLGAVCEEGSQGG